MTIKGKVRADKLKAVSADSSRYDLRTLVDRITAENSHELVDWGKPVGKEHSSGATSPQNPHLQAALPPAASPVKYGRGKSHASPPKMTGKERCAILSASCWMMAGALNAC